MFIPKYDNFLGAYPVLAKNLDSGINIGVRLLFFGLFSRGYVPYNNNNFPQSGPALQGCTVNVPVPKAVSS